MKLSTSGPGKSSRQLSAEWWASQPRPRITPAYRRDFVRAVTWAIFAGPVDVRLRHGSVFVDCDRYSAGTRAGLAAASHATHWPPKRWTPIDWLDACEAWENENRRKVNAVLPPSPWRDGPDAPVDDQMHSLNFRLVAASDAIESADAVA